MMVRKKMPHKPGRKPAFIVLLMTPWYRAWHAAVNSASGAAHHLANNLSPAKAASYVHALTLTYLFLLPVFSFAACSKPAGNFWDRGLLGLTVDPGFPARPYIYVLYTFDSALGGTPPRWGDTCPDPPGAIANGCNVSGRLSRLELNGNVVVGDEVVLVEDWPQTVSEPLYR